MASYPSWDESKDPLDISDWTFDFSPAMSADDAITNVALTAAELLAPPAVATGMPDVSVLSTLFTGQLVTLWLDDGQPNCKYVIQAMVQTADGRTLNRRMILKVANL